MENSTRASQIKHVDKTHQKQDAINTYQKPRHWNRFKAGVARKYFYEEGNALWEYLIWCAGFFIVWSFLVKSHHTLIHHTHTQQQKWYQLYELQKYKFQNPGR